nr:peptide chain release factor N(5)-glutamine methyltransferase [Acinetobacter sp. Marseille-Q1620]
MNIAEALAVRGEIDSYERQENAWLLEFILKLNPLEFKLRAAQNLTVEQQQAYLQAIQRIENGEPLAYIIGFQPFWTLDLKVTRDTLVPRPDTEVLVETVLALSLPANANIVDLGTGTGAIALSLASEKPDWNISATDIYLPTLDVARENAILHDLNRVNFFCGAWFNAMPKQKFDLIVSNPPYIDAEDEHMLDLRTEPERALVAGNKGLADIEVIISQGIDWLNDQGWIVLEHGYDQGAAVQAIFQKSGYSHIKTIKDYAGNDRVTLGQWI